MRYAINEQILFDMAIERAKFLKRWKDKAYRRRPKAIMFFDERGKPLHTRRVRRNGGRPYGPTGRGE